MEITATFENRMDLKNSGKPSLKAPKRGVKTPLNSKKSLKKE
jgi:hypothetical protein